MVDQADFFGPLGRQHLAGHQIFLGARKADELRPDQRAAVPRDQADLDVRIADHGGFHRDDHVAKQSDRGAETGCGAVKPADDRFLEIEQRRDDPLGFGRNGAKTFRVVDLLLEPGRIAAGAKGPALTR